MTDGRLAARVNDAMDVAAGALALSRDPPSYFVGSERSSGNGANRGPAPDDVASKERGEIRERFARLARYTVEPIEGLRLTLRHPETRAARLRWVADASLVLKGRRFMCAHHGARRAPCREGSRRPPGAPDRRVADAAVALRNERRAIQRALALLAHERKHRPGRVSSGRTCAMSSCSAPRIRSRARRSTAGAPDGAVVTRAVRWRDVLTARLGSFGLDSQLAAGVPRD